MAEETRMSDERAWFLSVFREESEERIERVFHAGENAPGFEAIGPSLSESELGARPFSKPVVIITEIEMHSGDRRLNFSLEYDNLRI